MSSISCSEKLFGAYDFKQMSLDPPTRELVILDVNMESEETVTEDLVTVEDIKPEDPVANVFTRLRLFEDSSLTELGCSSWSSSKENDQPYCRGCSISPDGACCLVVVHCDGIHLIELDGQLLCGEEPSTDRKIDILDSVIHSKESGLVYDFCWYPGMDSALPETCW